MTPPDAPRSVGGAFGAIAGGGWKARAKQAAATLKAEYEAGKQGDMTPATPIWSTPKEQLDALVGLLRVSKQASQSAGDATDAAARADDVADEARPDGAPSATDRESGTAAADSSEDTAQDAAEDPADDATTVTSALKGVDWAGVRAATAERTGDAAKAMKAMADQVDWARVQPVAAHISSALIAAVASGQVPIGGRLGGTVARAIADQSGLGQRVARNLETEQVQLPPDFRRAIEATSREV